MCACQPPPNAAPSGFSPAPSPSAPGCGPRRRIVPIARRRLRRWSRSMRSWPRWIPHACARGTATARRVLPRQASRRWPERYPGGGHLPVRGLRREVGRWERCSLPSGIVHRRRRCRARWMPTVPRRSNLKRCRESVPSWRRGSSPTVIGMAPSARSPGSNGSRGSGRCWPRDSPRDRFSGVAREVPSGASASRRARGRSKRVSGHGLQSENMLDSTLSRREL